MSKPDHHSRKFILSAVFTVVGSLALLTGIMGGGEFVALATLVLGVYGASNVAEKHVTREQR